jgi:hypothetical protein
MNIIPKYVIVDENSHVVGGQKTIESARNCVKGTNNKIYNIQEKQYEK